VSFRYDLNVNINLSSSHQKIVSE